MLLNEEYNGYAETIQGNLHRHTRKGSRSVTVAYYYVDAFLTT